MGAIVAVATLAILGFIGWLVYRAVKGKQVKAHHITYGIAVITGIFTYAFFLNMDVPQLIKIVISIFVGIILIFLAASIQRRHH